jgi:hypothetical protein
MNTLADRVPENNKHVVVNEISQKQIGGESTFQFADNRTEAVTSRMLQKMAIKSPLSKHASQLKAIANSNIEKPIQKRAPDEEELLQGKFNTIQKKELEEEELLQGKFDPVQLIEEEELLQGKFETVQMAEEEEELLQGKFEPVQKLSLEEEEPIQGKFITLQKKEIEEEELLQGKFEPIQKVENNTGLPDNLKSGIENLSGYSMDDVKVNYNSDKPAQLNAHAYAQGTDIHLASGQEKHLPHEAWHVVQQKQGRVKPTMQMKGKVKVNDDVGLEKEADVMGAKAIKDRTVLTQRKEYDNRLATKPSRVLQVVSLLNGIAQRNLKVKGSADGDKIEGGINKIRIEVTQVIARNKPEEMVSDIGKLETSIASRKAEQSTFKDTNSEKYKSHAARILQEEAQLRRLQVARDLELASRPTKKQRPKADANGWTTV